MTMISNPDGSVGVLKRASYWDLGKNTSAKLSLLYNSEVITTGKKTSSPPQKIDSGFINNKNIGNFINKLQKFYYAPPSDNLWTVQIYVHEGTTSSGVKSSSTSGKSLGILYNNITYANKQYRNSVSSNWDVKFDQSMVNSPKKFIEGFSGDEGLFLAQTVSFKPYYVTVNENVFSQGNSAGFLTFGKVLQNKNGGNECNINFLVSNWDITDILIDPWIAAIAQYGLIEDSSIPTLKADIIVREYSASVSYDSFTENEKNSAGKDIYNEMRLRKTYKFFGAFPTSRGEISKSYEYNQAGVFKNNIVNFKFDEYNITYHI